MIDYSELYEFIIGENTVHCKDRDEASEFLDIIAGLGVPIGFEVDDWLDRGAKFFSLGTMVGKDHELHCSTNRKFRNDGVLCEFSTFKEKAEAADVIPEIDELPSLEFLIGF